MTPTTLTRAPSLTIALSPPVRLYRWPVFSSVRIRQLASTPSSTVPTRVMRCPATGFGGVMVRLVVGPAVSEVNGDSAVAVGGATGCRLGAGPAVDAGNVLPGLAGLVLSGGL